MVDAENSSSSERETAESWVFLVTKRGLGPRQVGREGIRWTLRAKVVLEFDERR
jgi:hypothetical protein